MPLHLTNLRVCHRYTYYPDPQFDSIVLEAIASTGLRTISWPWLLGVGGVFLLIALLLAQDQTGMVSGMSGGCFVLAVLFIAGYFLSRKKYIVIESKGGFLMRVAAKDLTLDECYFMINSIDRAKVAFLQNGGVTP